MLWNPGSPWSSTGRATFSGACALRDGQVLIGGQSVHDVVSDFQGGKNLVALDSIMSTRNRVLKISALTGTEFLASEPYGSGIASSVTLVNKTAAETTLALAYPGEGTYVLLAVGRDGRIIRERLAAANHLVSRSFVYPEPEATEHDHHNENH